MNSMHWWHVQSARPHLVSGARGPLRVVVPLGLAALLGAAACTDSPEALDQQRQAALSDAVHGPEAGRVAGFYFLPPVVPRPALRGAFVPEVSPTVQIDRIDPATGATLRAIATFTRTRDHDGAAIRVRRQGERCEGDDEDGAVDDPNGYFWVRWRTRGLHLSTDAKYRIRVRVPGGRELGFADVRVVDRERDRRAIDRNEFVALRRDHDLVIRFRIDRPAVDGDGDGVFDWDDNCPTVANADQRDSVGNHVGDLCRCVSVTCAATDACHVAGTCSPTTGLCSNPVAPDGAACGAGQVCREAVCVLLAPPRLIAPLSTATVTSRTPTLRWSLPSGATGARVQVCRDRACAEVIAAFDVTGDHVAPTAPLPHGVVFWRVLGRAVDGLGTFVSPTWEFAVGARSAPVDSSWGTFVDANGDGFADVAVGASAAAGGVGRVYVYLGSATGPSTTPATTLTGPDGAGGEFGRIVVSAGDVNGDGFADLAVVANGAASGVGRVYVYLGNATGPSTTPATTITGPDAIGHSLGLSLSSAGDVNGDGYADVVVGATASSRADVFLGSASGLPSSPSSTISTADPNVGRFAYSVAGVGDVNGDGYGDVLVGASTYVYADLPDIPIYLRHGYFSTGYLYLGSATSIPTGIASAPPTSGPWPTSAATVVTPLNWSVPGSRDPSHSLPVTVSGAGDVNGDGYADVLVGSAQLGQTWVYWGEPAGVAAPVRIGAPPLSLYPFTGVGAGAGDVDGDGLSDVIVGNYNAASLYLGSVLSGGPPPVATWVESTASDGFGSSVAGAGDLNGDGFADVVVGAPGGNYAQVFLGNASGLPPIPSVSLVGPNAGSFGISVARARTPLRDRSRVCLVRGTPRMSVGTRTPPASSSAHRFPQAKP